LRIGILEDYGSLAEALELTLSLDGHSVVTASTAEALLDLVGSARCPDLILVDLRLSGGRSGADVIRESRAIQPDLPAILMSAAPLRMLAAAADGLPRVRILQKPFPFSALLRAIGSAGDRPGP